MRCRWIAGRFRHGPAQGKTAVPGGFIPQGAASSAGIVPAASFQPNGATPASGRTPRLLTRGAVRGE